MNLKARYMAVALLAAGCSSETVVTEDATTEVAEALGDVQDADVPMGRELMGGIPVHARRWEHEGIQCDTTPESASVEVCGQTFQSELHLAWTECQARFMGHGGRSWHGGPPGSEGDASTAPRAPVSAGSVDVVTTVAPTAECAEGVALRFQQQSTHDITHTRGDGSSRKLTGTLTSTVIGVSDEKPQSRSTTVDTTRARLDAEGNVIDSLHLTGSLEETFDSAAVTPTHVSSGTLTSTDAGGNTSTVTLSAVTRVPPSVCTWPVSGTLERAEADGSTHVLVYGPECGQATLDGESITLPSRPGRGGEGRGGGRGGPRGGGHGGRPRPGGAPDSGA
ncbi:hypothetical protein [Pyxidicoccus xibeiensis]|uniref:hypothetical protein n=1 Tax=Pyxidicoccus xibeiensis TaxID=2906759 RepID=UPI0020A729F8|nr:hypothetical protein [Pyxidicoccus xibeiensis]MCP3145119.1 hypothetical protein [Pyxidicoccus xibeiensis]